MPVKVNSLLLLFLTCSVAGWSQHCTELGQTPQTAFPICGLHAFTQTTVPFCANYPIPVVGCGSDYGDVNPFWYKFTCFKSGTLAFTITPNKTNEDYDWQIFDVTGRDVSEVYSNPDLFVVGNWAGTYGATGAASWGTGTVQCFSQPSANVPTFSTKPNLVAGHNYLLLISHFTPEPNGYTLEFTDGTAIITDTLQPTLKSANINCDAMSITIALNKKVKCASLSSDGSEFTINTNAAGVVSAQGINCSNSFDMDSLTVKLSNALQPGKYKIYIQKGNDNNTLLDFCENPVAVDDSVSFEVIPLQPTPFDSIAPAGCAPDVIQLVFKKEMRCNSIAADGSDFTITGTTPVTVKSAGGACSDGLSRVINIQLTEPLRQAGNYRVHIAAGTDGNTIIDECAQETLASSLSFTTADTVSAVFDYKLLFGCTSDTIFGSHDGNNGVTQWSWNFADGYTSTAQNAAVAYTTYGAKQVSLKVTNGTCSDSASATVHLDNELKAAFNIETPVLCPADLETFTDTSTGNIISWHWDFNNGVTSDQKSPPPQSYSSASREYNYKVSLAIQNDHNCFDTAYGFIKVLNNCYITVPSAFTPNGDNLNDYLYPLNAFRTTGLEFNVYNRYGQLLFSTKDWTKKWDGTFHGLPQPTGTYVWMLSYTTVDTKQKYFLKGTSVLIR